MRTSTAWSSFCGAIASFWIFYVRCRTPVNSVLPQSDVRGASLEYGRDSLEIYEDAVNYGRQALITDKLLAAGGTAKATTDLVDYLGHKVHGSRPVIELAESN
jgi:adenine/guanine phosphoribosyltransferase-like PRPP-binding protein